MKSFFVKSIALVALVVMLPIVGCKSSSNVDQYNNKPFAAFNDEAYVWENWSFSTNQVEYIEK